MQEQTGQSEERGTACKKNTDITGALLLIAAGSLLLLNNFGIISWRVWDMLWRFWPVLFILLGLQLIFGKRGPGKIIITIIGIILIALAFALSIASVNSVFQKWLYREFPIIQQFPFSSYSRDSLYNNYY